MIELGKVQELEILRTKEFGVYVGEKAGDEASVLLPKKQVPLNHLCLMILRHPRYL